jgi:organic radical activating enzyme
MKPETNNTFCYFPFSQLALKEWRDGIGIVSAAPCCNSIRPETPDPLHVLDSIANSEKKVMPLELFHGPAMTAIREEMLAGERPQACNTCWKMEDRGGTSYRIFSVAPDDTDFNVTNPRLQCIDLSLGENCNLRCRMCLPGLSNKLRHDYKYFAENKLDTSGINGFEWERDKQSFNQISFLENTGPASHNETYFWNSNEQWQNILDNIHNLREIKATGGEPTIVQPFLQFLDKAIEVDAAKNIHLNFHTNATKFTNSLVKKMLQFKGAPSLNLSIDSVGKNYEYIRYPMKWKSLEKSLDNLMAKFDENDRKLNLFPTIVLSVLNAHYIPDLYEWYKEHILHNDTVESCSFFVDLIWPDEKFINVKFLTKDIKLDLISKFRILSDDDGNTMIQHAIKYLEENLDFNVTDEHRQNMLREITVFDKSRDQDYHEYLHPDIIKYLDTRIT